jgi:hypothetical protein
MSAPKLNSVHNSPTLEAQNRLLALDRELHAITQPQPSLSIQPKFFPKNTTIYGPARDLVQTSFQDVAILLDDAQHESIILANRARHSAQLHTQLMPILEQQPLINLGPILPTRSIPNALLGTPLIQNSILRSPNKSPQLQLRGAFLMMAHLCSLAQHIRAFLSLMHLQHHSKN